MSSAIATSALLSPRPSEACAPAPHPDQIIRIADEEALIVWDAARKTEHFVRRASFRHEGAKGKATDFGFLVPTPTQPTLGEASDSVFATLEGATHPQHRSVTKREYQLGVSCFWLLRSKTDSAHAPAEQSVRVLDTARVAGFDAVVLEADSPSALGDWLAKHGYDARPALTSWLAPYVAAKWKISAFKIAPRNEGEPQIATSAVRMTFQTDKPFFPYREPDDQRTGPQSARLLDVYVVSTAGKLEGAIGEDRHLWPGALSYGRSRDDLDGLLAAALPAGVGIGKAWLMRFRDTSSPRPGTDDLFFAPAATQTELVPPPITWTTPDRVLVPVDLLALAAALVVLVIRLATRKRAAPGPG